MNQHLNNQTQFTLPTLDVLLLPPSNLSTSVCRRRRQFLTADIYFSFLTNIVPSFPQQPLVVDHHLFHKIHVPLKCQIEVIPKIEK